MKRAKVIFTISVPAVLLISSLLFGSILLLRLSFAVIFVLSLSYLWTMLSIRRINIMSSSPPEHMQAGDTFSWQAEITNKDRFPQIWLKLQNDTDLPGQRASTTTSIPSQSSYIWKSDIKCLHRGIYHIGSLSITATDPFGLFTRQLTNGPAKEFIVYPATLDLPHFKASSFNDTGSGYRSLGRISSDASGVRDFNSGDSLQHIHWRSTARTGKIMVKLFDVDRSYNASKTGWILLDMSAYSHFTEDNCASDDYAVTIAASIIEKYLQDGMRIGLLASDHDRCLIKPDRGEEHRWRLLKALALMQRGNGDMLDKLVSRDSGIFRDNPLIIVIATSATRSLMETIRQMKNHGDLVVVIYLDIGSWGGVEPGMNRTQALQRLGAQVYVLRKNDELAAALDSKTIHSHPLVVLV